MNKEGYRLDSAALTQLMMYKSMPNETDQIDHNDTNNFMDNSLQQVVSSLNDGAPSEENLMDELLNGDQSAIPFQERRRGAYRQPTLFNN